MTAEPYRERSVVGANFVFFGGSAGIGQATARALAARGASVLIVARGREDGEACAAQARRAGAGAADFLPGDLSTVAGIQAVAQAVRAWRPILHGVVHTAITAFRSKVVTADGLELAFALQYLARASLNRLLFASLAASGDGRIVHIAGDVPGFIKVDLDDLQFERRAWSFVSSVFGTHVLGALHVQEAARRWKDTPVTIAMSCVGNTRTKAMTDPAMPWWMRAIGKFGTSPEISARNAVRLLTQADASGAKGAKLKNPKVYRPEQISVSDADAGRLWSITTEIAERRGLKLP